MIWPKTNTRFLKNNSRRQRISINCYGISRRQTDNDKIIGGNEAVEKSHHTSVIFMFLHNIPNFHDSISKRSVEHKFLTARHAKFRVIELLVWISGEISVIMRNTNHKNFLTRYCMKLDSFTFSNFVLHDQNIGNKPKTAFRRQIIP